MQELRLDRVAAREPSDQVGAIFEEFFDLEHERLLRALYLVVGERQEAEDLAQDAFVKVLERWETVRWMDSPTGYLYRTAMNTFRTRYRRAVMAVRRIALLAPRQGNPYEDVEMTADVREALSALTPRQRAAIVLTELLGYGGEEAGVDHGDRALHRESVDDSGPCQDAISDRRRPWMTSGPPSRASSGKSTLDLAR